jgi:tol-pal system protein YbgF
MNNKKQSMRSIIIALTVILIGLFLVCAQRYAKESSSSDLSADDEQFRQELLEMLDLADDLDEGEEAPALTQDESEEQTSEDDILSLLVPEGEESQALEDFSAQDTQDTEAAEDMELFQPEPTETAENMGLSEDMFRNVQRDVRRLENILAEKSAAVDSLRRIMEIRNARIQELEQRLTSGRRNRFLAPSKRSSSGARYPSQYTGTPFMNNYLAARSQFENFQYQAAIESFQGLLNQYPDHPMADNCQYWIGECYYGMRQYQKAIIEFEKVFAYAATDKHDDAQLMIGLSYVKMGQTSQARQAFETLLNTYIDSEYTGIAQRYYRNL